MNSNIVQKIYELRLEILKSHPNAELLEVTLNTPAKHILYKELNDIGGRLYHNINELYLSNQIELFGIKINIKDYRG